MIFDKHFFAFHGILRDIYADDIYSVISPQAMICRHFVFSSCKHRRYRSLFAGAIIWYGDRIISLHAAVLHQSLHFGFYGKSLH
jgi:hypothetical protein